MTLKKCSEVGRELLNKHGLTDWAFQFDKSVRRFGLCSPRKKLISMSWKLVSLNNEERVRKTILHEIAHALTPNCHHNWKWKAKLIEIGGDGRRCYSLDDTIIPKAKYIATCPACGHSSPANKILKVSCGHCSKVYDPEKKLIYKLND